MVDRYLGLLLRVLMPVRGRRVQVQLPQLPRRFRVRPFLLLAARRPPFKPLPLPAGAPPEPRRLRGLGVKGALAAHRLRQHAPPSPAAAHRRL
jgi:hypothetical protein